MSETPPPDPAEGARLIAEAFERARTSGRPGSRQMTAAVLKNRILTATNRTFDESQWGVSTFREFLKLFPELVTVDESEFPALVSLSDADNSTTSGEISMTPHDRIRQDIWDAILDYSGGRAYIWDRDQASAQPVDPEGAELAGPLLPTATPETIAEWRERFVSKHESKVSAPQAEALERWKEEQGGTQALPSRFRGLWNAELKRHVIARAQEWFLEQGLPIPRDLVISTPHRTPSRDTERLRDFVRESVGAMTREELESLNLPAAAVMRVRD